MELKDKEWKAFFIEDIFKIKSGVRLTKSNMKVGDIPFIGATDSNNGITEFISNKNSSLDKNVLGVNYNGSVVHNFYHPYQAIFSDDVKRLSFKNIQGNKYLFLFVKTVILQQKSKYEYGYKFNGTRMKRQKILLPINENGEPDYVFMEKYMRLKETELLEKYRQYISSKIKDLNSEVDENIEWKEFEIGEIFQLTRGRRLIESHRMNGKTAYYSASKSNNGLTDFINNPLFIMQDKIIVSTFCDAYFVKGRFTASDEITILSNNFVNEFSGKFIAKIINSNQNKYAFGRKAFSDRLIKQKIILPVNKKGNPDFEYMENYIKQIEQRKLRDYLEYKGLV